jgi:hypothetical protein
MMQDLGRRWSAQSVVEYSLIIAIIAHMLIWATRVRASLRSPIVAAHAAEVRDGERWNAGLPPLGPFPTRDS